MKAITFQGIQSLAYEDIPDPGLLDSTDAIIRVTAAGICGSDLHPYFGREQGLDVGTVMGHELLGEVVEIGSDVRRFSIGDIGVAPFTTNCGSCFFCRSGLTARCETGQLFGWIENGVGLHGTQAEFVRVPMADSTLVVVPDGLDEGVALLAGDILSTAAFGAELAGVQTGDLVVVVGCGPCWAAQYPSSSREGISSGRGCRFSCFPTQTRKTIWSNPSELQNGKGI